ncbi:MAG: ROK family protein [Anaerolineae bacterium]|jgi:glucokinase|nr:ROK family protein [Anaerolineae bacterium]MDX9829487.1 ROK family protein [Anaerolineae bacterium]
MPTGKRKEVAGHTISIDLGGTKMLAAVVDGQDQIVGRAKMKTMARQGVDEVIQRLAETAQQAADKARVKWDQVAGVGIGAPGPVDPEAGVVYNPPNLPGWKKVSLGPRLADLLGVPVYVENDVNLGTLGEYRMGAGRGTRDMVGIFVGTGVGGGLILDGKLRTGFRHAAGELGHMVVLADGPVCGCGRRGCLEALASRTAVERDIRLGLQAGRESLIPELSKGRSLRLTSSVIAKAFHKGDPLVADVIRRAQWYLGLLTASVVNLLDPEMVVFGGGVVEALDDAFLDPIRVTARQHYIQKMDAGRVRIVPGKLGDYAAVFGAAALVRDRAAGIPPARD